MSPRPFWCAFFCFWIFEVLAVEQGSTDLLVKKGDSLIIDTENLQVMNHSSNLTVKKLILDRGAERSANCSDADDIAVLAINGSIHFDRGSQITLTGNRSLVIKSKGDITINTTLEVTCKSYDPGKKRCLGAYLESTTPCELDRVKLFIARSPHWTRKDPCKCKGDNLVRNRHWCLPGASHGGIGGSNTNFRECVKSYGKDDFTCMEGGSAGIALSKGGCVGGGAIEIRAEGRKLTIGRTISASAVVLNSSKAFTGCSGGLIRLIANEVEMRNGSSLRVDGADASSTPVGIGVKNGGGAGGVIQIIAPLGIVRNISLHAGKNFSCSEDSDHDAESGVIVIKNNRSDGNYIYHSNSSFVNSGEYKWGSDQQSSEATTDNPTLGPIFTIDFLSQELSSIKENMIIGGITDQSLEKLLSTLHKLLNISSKILKEDLVKYHDIFENNTDILMILSKGVPLSKTQEIFDLLMKIATSVIAVDNHVNWKESKKMPDFLNALEKMVLSMISSSTNSSFFQSSTETVVVQVNQFTVGDIQGYRFPQYGKLPDNSFVTEKDFVYIPKTALPKTENGYKFVVFFFKDIHNGLPDTVQQSYSKSKNSSMEVASLVMSCNLLSNGVLITKLQSPATLNFVINQTQDERNEAKCAFWNMDNNSWDSEGVSVESVNSLQTVCTTTHFTNFAVLMQHTPIPLTEDEKLSLLLITYIGCGVSILALLIATIVFISMEALSSDRHRIHLNLSIALLLSQITFLIGIKATEHETLCKIVAGTLHYYYLASFTWMLIEGVHLYLKVVKVFGIENIKIRQYYIIGWGLPVLIVGIAVIINPHGYGTSLICWLSLDNGFVWAFIGPVVAIVAINIFILAAVVKTVVSSASTMKSSDHSHIKAGIKGALVLMPLMGITWFFGLLAVNRNLLIFQYVFSISNSLQGFFIFILHVVLNNEVRMAFKRHREKKQLSKESGDYNQSISQTNNSDKKLRTLGKSSSSISMSGFGRLKARLSMSMMTRTSRVVAVQPINNIDEVDDNVKVNRKFHQKSATSYLGSSRLNSPTGIDPYYKPPCHSPLKKVTNTSAQL